jgi:uncharacterized protein (TIGR00255 family)
MIKSMTGFGTATCQDEQVRIQVEVKSLNSKHADISLRLPKAYLDKELTWKNWLVEKLERGRISFIVHCEYKQVYIKQIEINQVLLKSYYSVLTRLAQELGAHSDIFAMSLKIPGVLQSLDEPVGGDPIIQKLEEAIWDAIEACDTSRQEEGAVLEEKISHYLQNIGRSLAEIERLDAGRTEAIRTKLVDKLKGLHDLSIDENRLEQELIYYIERMDMTEEKVRLGKHLDYFKEVMQEENSAGKKLSFITQEIGREINTIGAKANDASIQRQVVLMKDELEKVKEQLQNIL